MLRITLSGNGRVASYFRQALTQSSTIDWVGWYARRFSEVEKNESRVPLFLDPQELPEADLHLICISDDAIQSFVSQISVPGVLAHTSGALGLEVYRGNSDGGVFYPLQSFTDNQILNASQIPICIEAPTQNCREVLEELAQHLGLQHQYMNSVQRLQLHLAAVFANNFVNHQWSLAEKICNQAQIPFQILQPLIENSMKKMQELGPQRAQTGPALRNDQKTLQKHIETLQDKSLQDLYEKLSASIQKSHEL